MRPVIDQPRAREMSRKERERERGRRGRFALSQGVGLLLSSRQPSLLYLRPPSICSSRLRICTLPPLKIKRVTYLAFAKEERMNRQRKNIQRDRSSAGVQRAADRGKSSLSFHSSIGLRGTSEKFLLRLDVLAGHDVKSHVSCSLYERNKKKMNDAALA